MTVDEIIRNIRKKYAINMKLKKKIDQNFIIRNMLLNDVLNFPFSNLSKNFLM